MLALKFEHVEKLRILQQPQSCFLFFTDNSKISVFFLQMVRAY